MNKKRYFENLDGLRFLCFLSVFFFHSFHTDFDAIKSLAPYVFIKDDVFGNGNIGVNFFFVLSGFLITYLLIEEKKLIGQINIRKFWIRRMLRIWPLYYCCVFFGFVVFPYLKLTFGQTPNETASVGYYLVFLNNFDSIRNGSPDASVLAVLWSVAIEEQFYLVWPVILFLLPVRRYYIAFAVVILLSLIFRALNDSPLLYDYHTLSCMSDMATGAFGAWLMAEIKEVKEMFINLSRRQILFIYFLFTFVFFFREVLLSSYFLRIFERFITAIIILFIILEQNYARKSFFKLSRCKTISRLGTISYGLYCLHFIGILMATFITKKLGINTRLWEVLFVDTGLALAFSIILASLSYRYFEKPFLNWKKKFALIHTEA